MCPTFMNKWEHRDKDLAYLELGPKLELDICIFSEDGEDGAPGEDCEKAKC